MNRKLLSLLVTLVAMFGCLGNIQAQTWEWKGDTPAAQGSYYLYNIGSSSFVGMNNGAPVNVAENSALLFTLTEGLDGTDLQYTENGNIYYIYQSAGTYGYWKENDASVQTGPSSVTMKSFGDSYRWKIEAYNTGYQIYSNHKYESYLDWFQKKYRHVSENDRYIRYTGSGYDCSRTANQYNTDNGTFLFITSNQKNIYTQYYEEYTIAYNAAKTLNQQLGTNTPNSLATAVSTYSTVNYTTIVTAITELQAATQAAATTFYTNVSIVNKTESLGSVTLSCDGAIVENNTYTDEQLGTVAPNHKFVLTATPADDCYLVGWYRNAECTEFISDFPSKSDEMSNKEVDIEGTAEQNNIVYYAKFAQKSDYLSTITANATTGGKVSVSVNGTATEFANTATANYSSKSIDAPKHQYTLSAQAEEGFEFAGWAKSEDATTYLSTDASYPIEITASVETASDTYYAIFHPYYYSSVTVNAEIGGKVYVSTTNSAPEESAYQKTSSAQNKSASKDAPNHTYYIFAQAEDGYEFVGLRGQTNKNSINVKAESKDEANPTSATLTAVFAKIQQYAAVAPGKYYIKNVSTGRYMKCASKDLQYDIDVDGEKDLFELVLDEDNKYFIKNTNGNYITWAADLSDLGGAGNLNLDNINNNYSVWLVVTTLRGNYSYKFSETSTGSGIYNIYFDGGTGNAYLGVEGSTLMKDDIRGTIPASMQWQLIPAETANLKINASSHGTFCAPFNVTLPDGVEAYKVSEITAESAKLAKLELNNQVLPAGTPVIVKFADDESSINKDYNGLNTKVETSVSKDHLVGFYANGATAPVGSYVLQNQGSGMKFYIVGSQTINMPKNRCYMSTGATNSAKVLNIIFEEETAVNNIQNTPAAVEYYSINGTKLSAPKSGINIVKTADGSVKKIYVK